MICRSPSRHQDLHVYEETEQIQTNTNNTVILEAYPSSERCFLPDTGESENRSPEEEHAYVIPIPENRIQYPESEHTYVTPLPENRTQDPESEHAYVTPMSENTIQKPKTHAYACSITI